MAIVKGKGTKLQLSIASVYTDIAQLVNVTPVSAEMGTVETTVLASTAREFVSTILDGGELAFLIHYDPADSTHASLWSKFKAGTLESWKVILTDTGAAEITFDGIITNFPIDQVVVDGLVQSSMTVKVSGDVTITP